MDCGWNISDEVANIHTRTDAKNLVITARTIHLPEQKETIHMLSMLRQEAHSGSIHDLAHIPTHNCLADTAVNTGRLLDVDMHPDFRTLMEHKAFLSAWCRTFKEHNKLNTCERKGENAKEKTTSAFADSCMQFPWLVMSIFDENVLSVPGSHELFV